MDQAVKLKLDFLEHTEILHSNYLEVLNNAREEVSKVPTVGDGINLTGEPFHMSKVPQQKLPALMYANGNVYAAFPELEALGRPDLVRAYEEALEGQRIDQQKRQAQKFTSKKPKMTKLKIIVKNQTQKEETQEPRAKGGNSTESEDSVSDSDGTAPSVSSDRSSSLTMAALTPTGSRPLPGPPVDRASVGDKVQNIKERQESRSQCIKIKVKNSGPGSKLRSPPRPIKTIPNEEAEQDVPSRCPSPVSVAEASSVDSPIDDSDTDNADGTNASLPQMSPAPKATITIPLQDFYNYLALSQAHKQVVVIRDTLMVKLGREAKLAEWNATYDKLQRMRLLPLRRQSEYQFAEETYKMWEDRTKWDVEDYAAINDWLEATADARDKRREWRVAMILKETDKDEFNNWLADHKKSLDEEREKYGVQCGVKVRKRKATDDLEEPQSVTAPGFHFFKRHEKVDLEGICAYGNRAVLTAEEYNEVEPYLHPDADARDVEVEPSQGLNDDESADEVAQPRRLTKRSSTCKEPQKPRVRITQKRETPEKKATEKKAGQTKRRKISE